MKINKGLSLISALVMLASMLGSYSASVVTAQASAPLVRQISSSLSVSFPTSGGTGADISGIQANEIQAEARADGAGAQAQATAANHPLIHRSKSNEDNHGKPDPLKSPKVQSSPVASSNPGLFATFNALNHRDQRLASGGNQFSLEPPDQGLCVGNGYVMETINDALRVFDTSGNPLTGTIALNAFYGYAPAIDRSTGVRGPFITDPSCLYDSDTQRWFHIVLTLDVDPATGGFLGPNHLDIAVSTSSNPTGTWVIYRLPVQDDGTDGTPNHACSLGPCLGDYPHIGADKNGFYATTNEYSFFGPEFKSAQIYAFSKRALAANSPVVSVVQFDTTASVDSSTGVQPGFTVWPANGPAGYDKKNADGTEFFLSSNAGEEASGIPGGGFSNEVVLWALSNTGSLNSASPNVNLDNKVLNSEVYGIPPKSDQKVGNIPLGQCINDTSSMFGPGLGCWALFFGTEPAHTEVESTIDSNDTRMQQVWNVNGSLYAALDTVVTVAGKQKAGVAYFVVQPQVTKRGKVEGSVVKQGYVGIANNNLTYPAIAVLPNGKGIMAFTLLGQDYYPSAGYVSLDNKGTGSIHVATAGLGPDDGFTSYAAEVGNPPRTRWGDYGAAVTDGKNIWIASEYIGQTCTLTQYLTGAIGSCGGTRTSLANWGTRISGVTP